MAAGAPGDRPGVSFVVTVYNKERFLSPVLDALAAQEGEFEREIIVVDDGSRDGSAAIAGAFAERHPRTRVIVQANAGQVAATNAGAAAATMPFLKLVDGDDLLLPNATARLLAAMTEAGCGLAFGDFAFYDPAETGADDRRVPDSAAVERLAEPMSEVLRTNLFIPSALLISTALFRDLGGVDTRYWNILDYDVALRAAERTAFARIRAPVCLIPSEAPDRMSDNRARMYRETAAAIGDLLARRPDLPWRDRRLAFRRTATRAYLYARRNPHAGSRRRAWLLRCLSYWPFLGDYAGWVRATCQAYPKER